MAPHKLNVRPRELQAAEGLELRRHESVQAPESTARSDVDGSPNHQVLLITDRPERGKDLATRLQAIDVRVVAPDEAEGALQASSVVVIDVDLHHPPHLKQLSALLSAPRISATPIAALLRRDSRLESVQAAALGATKVVSARTSLEETCRIVSMLAHPAISIASSDQILTPAENLEQAGVRFSEVFQAAATGKAVNRAAVDHATDCVKAAIADGGIRQWLERVWTYDDTTYQHCMMVTGLAAEFAATLGFSDSDQQTLVRGALLHDIGKAKIPLAILNKPGRLNNDELGIMRTHAQIGHDLLRDQGAYEPEVLEVVLRHHELLDGSGYPEGLSDARINDLVRLTTICDIYAALIERRPYKDPMQPQQAFKILEDMGAKLESALVRAFMGVAQNSAAA
jgi:putative nucleotidyltransferase with HDIG domain